MKTAKRAVLLVLCAMLLVIASVLGTMAYLTDTKSVRNTFTVGNVQITLDEAKVDEYGKSVDPAERVAANAYKLIPGHTYTKDPTVTVIKGSEESYVRMLVTVDKKTQLDEIFNSEFALNEFFLNCDQTKWNYKGYTTDDTSRTYEFWYYTTVTPSATEDADLEPLFTEIKVPDLVNNEQLATLNDMNIDIVAEAIQADGFDTADEVWAAFADQVDYNSSLSND